MVGIPAGNTKTIVCDLRGKLPDDCRKLRLTTSLEVRWDRIALYRAADERLIRAMDLSPIEAELNWHGFHELRPRGPHEPQVPNIRRMSPRPKWLNTVAGWCTRYGDVAPLVRESDGRMAILNSGDGATLRFASGNLPPSGAGESRTFALYTRGWIKAADPNSEPDIQIWPFPGSNSLLDKTEHKSDWQLRYNTRWVPGDRFEAPK
jgi:hypothetical protein